MKLTQEEIQKIKDLQTSYSKISTEIGDAEIKKRLLKNQLTVLEKEQEELFTDLTNVGKKETELATELTGKYGQGKINLDTGEISEN